MNNIKLTDQGIFKLCGILSKYYKNYEIMIDYWVDYIEEQWDYDSYSKPINVGLLSLPYKDHEINDFGVPYKMAYFKPEPQDYEIIKEYDDIFSD